MIFPFHDIFIFCDFQQLNISLDWFFDVLDELRMKIDKPGNLFTKFLLI